MCQYNFLAREWIEVKLYIYWKYLLCFINAHTAVLFCACRRKKNSLVNVHNCINEIDDWRSAADLLHIWWLISVIMFAWQNVVARAIVIVFSSCTCTAFETYNWINEQVKSKSSIYISVYIYFGWEINSIASGDRDWGYNIYEQVWSIYVLNHFWTWAKNYLFGIMRCVTKQCKHADIFITWITLCTNRSEK